MQRQRREAGRLRLAPRARQIERRESADLELAGVDRLGAQIDDGGGREVARLDAACEVERGEHHAAPSIRPTMRCVTLRAKGMAKNAVTDATGQPTAKAGQPARHEVGAKADIEKGHDGAHDEHDDGGDDDRKNEPGLAFHADLPGGRDVIRKAPADQGVIKSLPCWRAPPPPPA